MIHKAVGRKTRVRQLDPSKKVAGPLVVVVGFILLLVSVSVAAQRSGRPLAVISDFPPPPASIVTLRDQSTVVVFGRVEETSRAKAERSGERVTPVRIHRLRVLEAIKGLGTKVQMIAVRQPGGTVDYLGLEISVADYMKPLEAGDELVLFLIAARPVDEAMTTLPLYDVFYGPAGAIKVEKRNGVDHALVPSQLSRTDELRGKADLPLIDLLRSLRIAK